MPISLSGSLNLSGSLTTTGTITATTLVVQTITSSISSITGSTNFGSLSSDTHTFTGSLNVTGALAVVTTGTEFQVNSTGVNLGNALTDSHIISGSVRINPNGLFVSGSGRVGINTTNPLSLFDVAVLTGGARRLLVNYDDSLVTIKSANDSATGESLRVWGDNIYFYTGSAGSELMRLTNTGRVGIGTTSPSTLLHLNSTSTQITLQNTSGGTNAERIGMFMNSNDTFKILSLNDNNTTRTDNILVANVLTGFVGIGANPASRLYISTTAGATKAYDDTTKTNIMCFDDTSMAAGVGGSITFGGYKTSTTNGGNFAAIDGVKENGTAGNEAGMFRVWTANSSGVFSARMSISSTGAVSITNNMTVAGGGANGVISIGDTTTASTGIYINTQTFGDRFVKFAFQGNPMGEIYYNGTNTSYAASGSDIRLKKNIKVWDENVLELFKDINPKVFNWNFQEDTDSLSKGFIAQEMTKKFPEAYHTGNDEFYLYNPSGMVVYLIKALQEQTIINQEYKDRLDKLTARVQYLENK